MVVALTAAAMAECPDLGDAPRALLDASALPVGAETYDGWAMVAVHPEHPWFNEQVIRILGYPEELPENGPMPMMETSSVFLPRGTVELKHHRTVSYGDRVCGWLVYEGEADTVQRLLAGELGSPEQRRIERMERRIGLAGR